MQRRVDEPPRLRNSEYFAPGARCGFFVHRLSERLPPHWHDFFELELVVGGNGTHVLNGTHFELRPGTLFLLTPADIHEIEPVPGGAIDLYNVIFTESFIRDAVYDLVFGGEEQEALVYDWPDSEERELIDGEFRFIRREMKQLVDGGELLVQGAVERILVLLSRMPSRGGDNRRRESRAAGELSAEREVAPATDSARPTPVPANIRRAITFIHHHFRTAITLGSVAERAGLSPTYFSESFHRYTGRSFQRYLQSVRLSFAVKLLRSTDMTITEVCHASGFNSLSHFERAFRRQIGASPREYRQS